MSLRIILLVSVVALQSWAQTALTGAIQGTVTDELGGAIPNVTTHNTIAATAKPSMVPLTVALSRRGNSACAK